MAQAIESRITRANFAATLPRFREAISRAAFVSFDTELSGLHTGDQSFAHRSTRFDLPEERYGSGFRAHAKSAR